VYVEQSIKLVVCHRELLVQLEVIFQLQDVVKYDFKRAVDIRAADAPLGPLLSQPVLSLADSLAFLNDHVELEHVFEPCHPS